MATSKTESQKVADLRKQAQDKSLPQQVRDMADKKANEIEGRSVKKETGIELAKGGAVAKPMAKKKFAVGGMASQIPLTEPKRGPATPAPTATPSMKDRVSKLSSMVKANTASTAQPKKVGGAAGQRQAQAAAMQKRADASAARKATIKAKVAPKTPVLMDKQVNVQPTKPMMAKGGKVTKKFAMGGMSSQIPLSDVPRQPATATTATPDRFKTMGEMARRAVAKQTLTKPQVNVQPTPRGGPTMKPQVNVQPTRGGTMIDKQVNVQPTRMAKGGAVKKAPMKKAKK